MGRAVALVLFLALAACGGEDFDERYADRNEALMQSADRMEQEMAQQLSQGQEADRAMGEDPAVYPAARAEADSE
jgi:hypothetical protein